MCSWPAATSPNERRRRYQGDRQLREDVSVVRGILSDDECARVSEAVARAQTRRGGSGWHTDRHAEFATVDLPAAELSPRAHAFVRGVVRRRVLAWFASRAGLDAADLFTKDLFVVLYDATNVAGQRELALHKDGSLFSFNVLLSAASDFQGGGTVFPKLGPVAGGRGDAVFHDGKVLHGGGLVTGGTRLLLVGFVDSLHSEAPSWGETPASEGARQAAEVRAWSEREARGGESARREEDALHAMADLASMSLAFDGEAERNNGGTEGPDSADSDDLAASSVSDFAFQPPGIMAPC